MAQLTNQLNTIAFSIIFQGSFQLDGQIVVTNQLQKAIEPIQKLGLFQAFKTTSLFKDTLLIISFVGVIYKTRLEAGEIDSVKTIISHYVLPNLGCEAMPQIDILPAGRQFVPKHIILMSTVLFLKSKTPPNITKTEAIVVAKQALSRIGYDQTVNCLPIKNGFIITLIYDLPSTKIDEIEKPLVDTMEVFFPYLNDYEISWKSSGFSVNP
jgi:hypothetical protein